MTRSNIIVSIFFLFVVICSSCESETEKGFKNPPDSAKPYTWWHWMDGNVSREGITRDLEAFKEVGIGGFQLFDVSWGIPYGGVEFNSDSYHKHLAYAMSEADRLGLEMGMNNSSGWSSTGGPWVDPEHSMKMLIWSELMVKGGQRNIRLAKPELNKLQKPYDFYRDVAVIAFPTPEDTTYRLDQWNAKALNDVRARSNGFVPDFTEAPSNAIVQLDNILVITENMDADGVLNWIPPAGNWTILRFGYSTTGAFVRPGSKGGKGLEIDKLSTAAAELQWKELLDKVLDDAEGKEAFTTILIDSYEVGNQNWTEGFDSIFREKCQYDLIPNLLCISGRVIQSTAYSERVLWDLRSTVADLMYNNYFRFFFEKCHKQGLILACEPYGTGSFDALRTAKLADLPMTEFWYKDEPWKRRNLWDWTSQIVPSAARLSAKKVVAAESFTRMQGDYTGHPYRMKVWGDRAFCMGVNRYYFHTSVHQPFSEEKKPGMSMGQFGINFHRNNTWFESAKSWLDYIARCQFIMQSGTYVSDFLVLYGEDRGFNNLPGEKEALDIDFIPGYKFDLAAAETLNDLSVDSEGIICVTNEGVELENKYKMLLLKRSSLMTVESAQLLGFLAEKGAVIFAQKPVRTPGLKSFKENDKQLSELVKKYWDSGLIRNPDEFEPTLNSIHPDCELPEKMEYCHHRLDNGEYYFISNQSYNSREVECVFKVNGMKPEIWNPETGETREAYNWKELNDGRTRIILDMSPAGSQFIVFRKFSNKKGRVTPKPAYKEISRLEGSWTVSFDPDYGPEEPVIFKTLIPWNEYEEDDIKYYSGTATYKTYFKIGKTSAPMYIDLGEVEVMARLKVNGEDLGVLWKPPFRMNITEAVHVGRNELEIEVTNLWPNRMIGDAKLSEVERKSFSVWKHWDKDDKLLPSGLLGPVKIELLMPPKGRIK